MATKNKQNEAAHDPEVAIESALNKTEQFLVSNGKTLLTILGAIIIVVGGYFGYKYLYQAPRAQKAADMMYVAEQAFIQRNFEVALNGDDNDKGFLEVVKNYGSTTSGNLANHYVGVCYAQLGKFDEALEYLKKYNHTDGVPNSLINAQNYGLQADIFSQKKDYTHAASLYEQAIEASNDILTTPVYLKKLGLVYMQAGENAKAKDAFQRVIDEYGSTLEARDAEKLVGMTEQL